MLHGNQVHHFHPITETTRFLRLTDLSAVTVPATYSGTDFTTQALPTPQNVTLRVIPATTSNTFTLTCEVVGLTVTGSNSEAIVITGDTIANATGALVFGYITHFHIREATNADANDELNLGTINSSSTVVYAPDTFTVSEVLVVTSGAAAKGAGLGTLDRTAQTWKPDGGDVPTAANAKEYVVVYRDR